MNEANGNALVVIIVNNIVNLNTDPPSGAGAVVQR